jgi:hypothetical protein
LAAPASTTFERYDPNVGEVYRDAMIGLRARIAEMDSVADERERRFAPDLLVHLPHEMRERLAELREACGPHGDTIDELARAERDRSIYVELLDRALALAPELEVRLREVPTSAPRLKRRGTGAPVFLSQAVIGEALLQVGKVVARVVTRHDPSAEVVNLDGLTFAAELRAHGAPLALLVECFVDPERPFEPRVQVATSVAEGTPHLHVAPEGWMHAVARTMGLRAHSATGDESFDERFVIEGESFAARSLLGADVRAALLAIGREDVPDLLVEGGAAIISWSFEPSDRALHAAFFALGRLRTAEVSLHLLAAE